MKSIHELLRMSEAQYDDMRLKYWLNWCEAKAVSVLEWQYMLTDTGLNRWFLEQFDKFEHNFRCKAALQPANISAQQLMHLYQGEVAGIFNLWLSPHTEDIRKITLKNNVELYKCN